MARTPPPGSPPGPPGIYRNPLRAVKGLTAERIDQGADFSGSGDIYALGPGRILMTKNSGWPGGAFIAELLTGGPYAGNIWYVAEDVQPTVLIGQTVDSNTVLGYFAGGNQIETGWGAPGANLGQALAYVAGQSCYHGDPGCHSTAYGMSASNLLTSLGAPRGLVVPPVQGTVGPGFPPATGTVPSGGGVPVLSGCVPGLLLAPVFLIARLLGRYGHG